MEHGRNYQSIEEVEMRFLNFMRSEAKVEVLNSLGHDATYAVNLFSDYTKEEYNQMLGLIEMEDDDMETLPKVNEVYVDEPMADNSMVVDWKAKGAVTAVKFQGACGCCWAFAGTGGMEGAHWIASGNLIPLSEQQLVDCQTNAHGCNGGYIGAGFNYAMDHKM